MAMCCCAWRGPSPTARWRSASKATTSSTETPSSIRWSLTSSSPTSPPRRSPDMAQAETDHRYDYSQAYLSDILRSVKSIAMVGASNDKTKFSYGVLRVLHETGYDMIPVNPNPNVTEIRDIPVYRSLKDIDRPVDMVEVFRPKEEFHAIAEQSIEIGAKVLWAQIDVYDDRAAKLAEDAGMKVVMDRCPKIELFRPFWKPRLDLAI